jgi:hypothetical protein
VDGQPPEKNQALVIDRPGPSSPRCTFHAPLASHALYFTRRIPLICLPDYIDADYLGAACVFVPAIAAATDANWVAMGKIGNIVW